jgi:hypothetical protein
MSYCTGCAELEAERDAYRLVVRGLETEVIALRAALETATLPSLAAANIIYYEDWYTTTREEALR